MIINFYISDQETRLIDQLRLISEEKNRSVSYIIREALESYVGVSSKIKKVSKKEARR
jgi:predicted DNA-binding protein